VPHARYLVDYGDIDPAVAATYACSGITVYAAIKKIMPLNPDDAAVLIGPAGWASRPSPCCGRWAIATSSQSISAPRNVGPPSTAARPAWSIPLAATSTRAIIEAAGGPVKGIIDFVNITETARFAHDALVKGGRLVMIGVAAAT